MSRQNVEPTGVSQHITLPSDRSEIDEILREQARRYAIVPPESQHGNETEVLVFQLGAEQYAIELGVLQSVHPARGITEVPCAPSPVVGILNVRGEVVTILDLVAAFGAAGVARDSENSRVLLVDAPLGGRVGLLVDEVHGVHRLAFGELDRSWLRPDYAVSIADARTILINLKQLLTSERFDVAGGSREIRRAD
jgi:purine-binding chemotaxis protein CheW